MFADIHGNLPALRSAVDRLHSEGMDRFLCAGDVVGYGPSPDECVELIAGLDALALHGNHDLIALGRLSDERCIPLARASLDWTRRRLGLPLARMARGAAGSHSFGVDQVIMAHGSLDDPQCYVRDGILASRELGRVADRVAGGKRVLILGHTHVARAWDARRQGTRSTPQRARRHPARIRRDRP